MNPEKFILYLLTISSTTYFIRIYPYSIYMFDIILLLSVVYLHRFIIINPYVILSGIFLIVSSGVSIFLFSTSLASFDFPRVVSGAMRYVQLFIAPSCFLIYIRRLSNRGILEYINIIYITISIPIYTGLLIFYISPGYAISFHRYSGYFGDPNMMALYIVIVTPLALFAISNKSKPTRIIYFILFFIPSIYSLMLSGSNSGSILFIIVLIIHLVTNFRGAILLIIFSCIVFINVNIVEGMIFNIYIYMQNASFWGVERFSKLLYVVLGFGNLSELGSEVFRKQIQVYLTNEYLSSIYNIIFGLGFGQSPNITSMHFVRQTVTIHNGYYVFLIEFGVLGCIFLFFAFYYSIGIFIKSRKSIMIVSGYLLALVGIPALYLPFYWAPVILCLITQYVLDKRKVFEYRETRRRVRSSQLSNLDSQLL